MIAGGLHLAIILHFCIWITVLRRCHVQWIAINYLEMESVAATS